MLARLDPDLMERLPDTGSSPAEIVVQAAHRNPYDHLVRASGARLVEFGGCRRARRVADMEAAIGPATAGAFYHGSGRGRRPVDRGLRGHGPRARAAGPRRRIGEPAAAEQPATVRGRGRRPRRVQWRQDDPWPAGVGLPRRARRPARVGRAPAAGHGRAPLDLVPPLARRAGRHRPAAGARDRALDEDRQGGDRRAPGRARAVRRPRRGGRGGPLGVGDRAPRRRAGGDPGAVGPDRADAGRRPARPDDDRDRRPGRVRADRRRARRPVRGARPDHHGRRSRRRGRRPPARPREPRPRRGRRGHRGVPEPGG